MLANFEFPVFGSPLFYNFTHKIFSPIQAVNKKKREKRKLVNPQERPGNESYRKTREDLTTMDKLHMALTELCYSINFVSSINVWEYSFSPREYLNQHLETR